MSTQSQLDNSDNLPAKNLLFYITHIRSRSPALKPLHRDFKSLFTWQVYWQNYLCSNNDLEITLAI